MVRFTLFGIPVEIQPWFWLTAVLLSGALWSPSPEAMQYGLIFILAATVSILVHEFGHALTGLRLGGGHANVVLWAFGGLAINQGGRFSKTGRFWMIAAGPGAGFLLGGVVVLALAAAFGPRDALSLTGTALFGSGSPLGERTWDFFVDRRPLWSLIQSMLWINFWWGMINLLPITPLDGGQIAELYVKPRTRVLQIAIAAAVGMAVVGALWMGSLYVPLLFGYLAWRNYQELQRFYGR